MTTPAARHRPCARHHSVIYGALLKDDKPMTAYQRIDAVRRAAYRSLEEGRA